MKLTGGTAWHQNIWNTTRRELEKMKSKKKPSLKRRLKLAAGNLRVQDLEEIDRHLVERRPPEEVIADEQAAQANR